MAKEAVVFLIGADAANFDKVMEHLKKETSAAASSMDQSLSESFSKLGGLATKAGTALTLGVTAPLLAIGTMAAKTAIDFTKLYESTMVVFRSMLGGEAAAQALYNSLLAIAKASTFSQETFLTAGKKLVGMGVDAETTTKILQATTDAVAGFGGSAQNIDQVVDAFAKMSTAGRLSMEDVNSLSVNGINVLKILGNQYNVTTDDMRKMISEGAVPSGKAIDLLTDGIENGTDGINGMTNAMAGMAASMKAGTLTGAFDSINTAIRSFSLALIGINPTLKETDAGYAESTKRIAQLTAAVTTIAEIIPLLAKMFSGVTSAIGSLLDMLVGSNVQLDQASHKWKNVNGALGDFKRYLRDTPTDRLAMIGNLLVAIAVTGPTLLVVGKAFEAISVAVKVTQTILATAKAAQTVYTMAVAAHTTATGAQAVATGVATAAQSLLNAAMAANPAGVVLIAIVGLVAAVGLLATAYNTLFPKQEQLTASSQKQKDKVSELQAEYDNLVAAQGESSDAALAAKAALDEETAAFEATKQTIPELVAECKDLSSAHASLMAELDKTTNAADMQAGSILHLADQLTVLSGIENKSGADKARLQAIVDQLNASVEGLNLTYYAQEDALSMSADAVKALATAEANRLRYSSQIENLSRLYTKESEITEDLARAKESLEGKSTELALAYAQLENGAIGVDTTLIDLDMTVKRLEGDLEENKKAAKEAADAAAELAEKETQLSLASKDVAKGMGIATAAKKYHIEESELSERIAQEEAEAQAKLAEQYSETAQALLDYIDAHPGFQNALAASGQTVESFSDLLVAQGVSFDEAAKQIESYSERASSGFDKVADSSKNSLDAMYETLAYNLEATQNWSSNLEAVFGRTGVSFSKEFVDAVRKGGVEEYGTVMAQMRDLSNEELQAISDAYARNGQAGVDSWMKEQQLLVPGTKEALEGTGEAVSEALAEGETAAAESGSATGTAYSENLKATIATCPEEVQQYITELEQKLASTQETAAQAGADTGSGYSNNLVNAIASCPAEVQAYISDLEQRLKVFEAQAGATGTATGVSYGANTAAGINSQNPAVGTAAQGLTTTVSDRIEPMPDIGLKGGTGTGANFASGLNSQAGATRSAADRIKAMAEEPISSIDGDRYGSETSGGFASGMQGGKDLVSSAAMAIQVVSAIMFVESFKAYVYGSHMTAQFAAGMRSQISSITAAASAAAAAARAQLHFTVPDEGPLSDADEYGPDFMLLLAAGMRSKISEIRAAASEAASAMSDEFDVNAKAPAAFSAIRGTSQRTGARTPLSAEGTVINYYSYYTVGDIDMTDDPQAREAADTLWVRVRRARRMK